MKRTALLLLLLALAAPAAARDERLRPVANPSAVIARELEFAAAAQAKGQWTAFRDFAAADAVMFTPQMVLAQGWLKNRANPPAAVRWQPAEVWSSCDGSLAVSRGPWQRGAAHGYFTTIWQRQKDGKYKWVLDSGDTLAEPLAVPELIPAHVADCASSRGSFGPRKGPKQPRSAPASFDPAARGGQADDGTVAWTVAVSPSGARTLAITWKKDDAVRPLLTEQVAAEGAR